MKLDDIKIDADKLEQGDWVGNIPDMGELRLKVRGLSNSDFRKMQNQLLDAEPRQFKIGGRLRPDRQDAIAAKCLLHTVLLDWEGMQEPGGQPIPYSLELARTLLTEPKYKRFREAVTWAAGVVAEDIAEDEEVDAKNSETPSAGT